MPHAPTDQPIQPTRSDQPGQPKPIEIRKLDKIETTGDMSGAGSQS